MNEFDIEPESEGFAPSVRIGDVIFVAVPAGSDKSFLFQKLRNEHHQVVTPPEFVPEEMHVSEELKSINDFMKLANIPISFAWSEFAEATVVMLEADFFYQTLWTTQEQQISY